MSTVSKRWWLVCMIAVIVGVFAYYFINIQRDNNPTAEKSVGG